MLGKPVGVFNLNDSNRSVGSYLIREDVCEILSITEADLTNITFKNYNNLNVIDERVLQKAWYDGQIKNSCPPIPKISLDEIILIALIKKAYPDSLIEQQIPWGRKKIDLKITLPQKSVFIEFHGPSHFIFAFNRAPEDPSIRKKEIEDKFGIECIIWPYWIQRCIDNVKAIFEEDINGLGVLWSTKVHFGMFCFENSAQIIEAISDRFRGKRDNGYSYFYGPNTENRNNPEHPIIQAILDKKETKNVLLPRGYREASTWLPIKLL